jgi:hypothetical protein
MAAYFSPLIAAHVCWDRATPGNVLLATVSCVQPPIFSGKPYLKRTKSPSIHSPSAPDAVVCLLNPGLKPSFF